MLTPAAIVGDGGAHLEALGELTDRRAGITGGCFGDWLGWVIAAAYPDRIAALAGFHTGPMVTDEPDSPHLLAPRIRAEVYRGHADKDQSMTAGASQHWTRRWTTRSAPHDRPHEAAQHGYTMSDTGAYNQAATERHFAALFALLERALPQSQQASATTPRTP